MSDFMYAVLAVSVCVNLYLFLKVGDLSRTFRSIDRLLMAVGKGEAKIVIREDNDWHVEKLK